MSELALVSVVLAVVGPLAATVALALAALLGDTEPSERATYRIATSGLLLSLLGATGTLVAWTSNPVPTELELGPWLVLGAYEVPLVFHLDAPSVVFSLLAAGLAALSSAFSSTYLHREKGFLRFFVLLSLFATGVQLVALAGALDLLFAGWELLGLSSALLIGFFKDRPEPVRSALRAFATYRLCDIAFFLAIVATHELLGSTRLEVLDRAAELSALERNGLAALFLMAALGKSAQLPFSSWLPRAMEGPTPSSALFYGGLSVHAGLYLLLRIHPALDVAPAVEAAAIAIGGCTAVFATFVARVQTDAKSALAFSTLAQTGLILSEIAAGFTTIALIHLVGHALLRVAQYLRAPNTLHDAHLRGHATPTPAGWEAVFGGRLGRMLFAWSLMRFRLDEWTAAAVSPIGWLSARLEAADTRLRRTFSLDGDL